MPEYRRSYVPGGTFFFTVVTYHRNPIFISPEARELFCYVCRNVQKRLPFSTIAFVLLPDHLHCIWTLPEEDANFSIRWSEIKRLFSKGYRSIGGNNLAPNESQQKRSEALIWQRRFWEHTIRDEEDLYRHIDYIHFNPVKHGLVHQVREWKWSSFHRYVKLGFYEQEWGQNTVDLGVQIKSGKKM